MATGAGGVAVATAVGVAPLGAGALGRMGAHAINPTPNITIRKNFTRILLLSHM